MKGKDNAFTNNILCENNVGSKVPKAVGER